ncbi:MAG: ABC transporter permease subunit [Planctomycetota bacterium]|nr:ABC transporter permease subunit [Planctomycetota bacterium]
MDLGWYESVVGWLEFASQRLPELWLRTGQHLVLTGISTGFAIAIGLPLGLIASQKQWLKAPLLGVIGVFQTVPSLAMLAILLTLVGKIGFMPAAIALTIYALLPIVRNTVTGIEGVPPDVVEASRGIGMTRLQQLRMVQLPLAMPVLIAGVRTAAVVGVGIATLSAFIGAGGLGQFINRGLALSNTKLILLGAIPAAVLAVIVDGVIAATVWGVQPTRQSDSHRYLSKLKPIALALPFLLAAVVLISALRDRSPAAGRGVHTIRIGSKNFSEQLILGQLMAQMIEAHTDLRVDRRFNLGGTMICHEALASGEIDLYAEYTGTGLVTVLKRPVTSAADTAFEIVSKDYREAFELEWLEPFGFNNTFALTVRKSDAEQNKWRKISDLKSTAETLRAGFTAEFSGRPDGYPGLREEYGFSFAEVHDLEPSLMYRAVAQREVDVICAFTTDGRIGAYELQPLIDDRQFFPPYYAAPVIRAGVLDDHPEVKDVLDRLAGVLNNETMQRLNYAVDENGRLPKNVAREFLIERELIVDE